MVAGSLGQAYDHADSSVRQSRRELRKEMKVAEEKQNQKMGRMNETLQTTVSQVTVIP